MPTRTSGDEVWELRLLDFSTSEQATAWLSRAKRNVRETHPAHVVLLLQDFTVCTLDSSRVGVLISFRTYLAEKGARVTLCIPDRDARNTLTTMRLDRLLDIVPSKDEITWT